MCIAAIRAAGYLPMISHLGAMISVVNGMLDGAPFQKNIRNVGAACIGDGGLPPAPFTKPSTRRPWKNCRWSWWWPITNMPIPRPLPVNLPARN
jgi:hypothetical protein